MQTVSLEAFPLFAENCDGPARVEGTESRGAVAFAGVSHSEGTEKETERLSADAPRINSGRQLPHSR